MRHHQQRYTPLRAAALLAAALSFVWSAASGCARLSSVSEVAPDGSMTRTVTVKSMGPGSPGGGEGMGPSSGSEAKLFDPPTGTGWTVTRGKPGEEVVFTATRKVAAGEVVHDIVLHAKPAGGSEPLSISSASAALPTPSATPAPPSGKVQSKPQQPKTPPKPAPKKPAAAPPALAVGPVIITNEVVVRQIAPGRLQYREVLRWNGPRPEDIAKPDAELTAKIKAALPPSLASDTALANKIGIDVQRSFFTLLFGPGGGDPIFSTFLMHQDLAEYRIKQRLAASVVSAVNTNIGDRLPAAERKAVSDRLISDMVKEFSDQTKSKAGDSADPMAGGDEKGKKDESGPLIAMFIRVKMPGRVVETNGEYDENTGEVIWPFYSQAVALNDLTLTATCEVPKQ